MGGAGNRMSYCQLNPCDVPWEGHIVCWVQVSYREDCN